MNWSLNELYTSFESEEFLNDMIKLEEMIKNSKENSSKLFRKDADPVKSLEQYIEESSSIISLFIKLRAFASLTNATDSSNEKALVYSNKLSVIISETTEAEVMFTNYIKNLDNLDEIIKKSELLKEHEFYLMNTKKKSKYLLSESEEVVIAKLKNTGSTAWTNLQNKITSNLMVDIEIDGEQKELPLTVVRNMAYDKDQALRKKAYEAELKAYEKLDESSAAALNGIKGEVITINDLRGYKSALDETLLNSRMDKETLDAMLTAMRESFPAFRRYFKKKAELLGHKGGLPFYDLFAPVGSVDAEFTFESAMDYVIKNFRTFSDRLADFTQNAYNKEWIDAFPRKGKRGGAFCSNLHPIKESRVLTNFSGGFSNMTTLAHELGHAYHGFNLKDERVLNSSYPMPIAETASIFCETIVTNAALKEASKEEALAILEEMISGAAQVIVDIYSRYLFETALFETRKDHPLSVKELKENMLNAQKETYGDGLDEDFLHPYMWVCKTHYYSAGLNFYNFPYAFGLLFSKGLYAEYLKRGDEFVKEYDDLLNATGKYNIADVAMRMNVDVRNPEFFRSSLSLIEKDIDKFVALVDELNK